MHRQGLMSFICLSLVAMSAPGHAAETGGRSARTEGNAGTDAGGAPVRATLDRVQVVGHPDPRFPQVLPEVEANRINTAKKTLAIDLALQPAIVNANPRALFARAPGVFVSDQYGQGQWNLGYRGLGDPHESEFFNVLVDGVPATSDWMTYNTMLWAPPLQRVERVEMVVGASGLLYGPQPGPAVTLVMRRAGVDAPLRVRADITGGSHGFRGSYNEIGAGGERAGFLVSTDYRESNGERRRGGSRVQGLMASGVFAESDDAWWTFDLTGYQSFNQEAGRLGFEQWRQNPDASIRPYDDFRVQRVQAVLGHERRIGEASSLLAKAWAGYHDRWSRRAGTVLAGQALPAFTTFDRQQFRFAGIDARLRHDWSAHTLTVGGVLYRSDSPRSQGRASDVLAPAQTSLRYLQERDSRYGALFVENAFRSGALSVVPALRLERLTLGVDETVRLASLRRPAIDREFDRDVALGGVGLQWQFQSPLTAYANLSQGYRPMRFDDIANPTAETVPSNDPDVSRSLSAEFGLRGAPLPGLYFDASLFRIEFDDKIEQRLVGVSDIERINSGDARHQGLDLALAYDFLHGTPDRLEAFVSNTWLDAEIVRSIDPALVGRRPQFAPDYLARAGLVYARADGARLSLTATFVDRQFWQDSNLPRGSGASFLPAQVPAYQVVDLAAEWPLSQALTLTGAIDNLADETYFSRIRTDGIEPAPGRAVFVGARVAF